MPFLGQEPLVGGYHVLDNITTSATNTYNLALGGAAFTPESANHLLVSLNGVIQKPGGAFSVGGSQITFIPSSGTLSNSDSIDFIIALGDVLNVGTPSDNTISTAKIIDNAVVNTKIANNAVTMDKLATSGTLPALNGSALTGISADMVHIKTQVGDNHSSVDFMHGTNGVIFDSTYDVYEFVIHYWYGASNSELEVLPSTNGSSYTKTGTVGMLHGVYRASNSNSAYNIDYGGGPNGGSGAPAQGFMRSLINCGDSKNELTSGTLRVYYPHDNQYTTLAIGQLGVVQGPYDAGLANIMGVSNSMCSTVVAATTHGVQFKASSGNCYTKISLYGLKDE